MNMCSDDNYNDDEDEDLDEMDEDEDERLYLQVIQKLADEPIEAWTAVDLNLVGELSRKRLMRHLRRLGFLDEDCTDAAGAGIVDRVVKR